MVGKLEVRAAQLDLGHVAADASVISDRAGFVGRRRGSPSRLRSIRWWLACAGSCVAGSALRIVNYVSPLQIRMRIVTGDAGEMRILRIVPPAVEQTIGLETNVVDASEVWHHGHRIDTPVTGPAKFLR